MSDNEAAFWKARYLELLQNHMQIVALSVKQDVQLDQVTKLGNALKQRAMQEQAAKGEEKPESEPVVDPIDAHLNGVAPDTKKVARPV